MSVFEPPCVMWARASLLRRCGVALLAAAAAAALPAQARAIDLADLSLEQLREVVVTSVSRREETLTQVAAAVYVISADDIRRSGATTLPEALRLAPTLNVARADANQYAISARGFNNVLANKMLVLIDGRVVYTPLFSGVFWEAQDVALEDVERIEVVTGPSTALWGSNAVNGLVHVITRQAKDTQGAAATVHAGSDGQGATVRYGGVLGDTGYYRLYVKGYDRRHTERADGSDVRDAARGVQTGFRADWALAADRYTLQGDVYRASIDQQPGEREIAGANLLGRWRRTLQGGGHLLVQFYADRTQREQPISFMGGADDFEETLETIDLVAQYGLRAGRNHELVFGAGYRHARDDLENPRALAFLPADRHLHWSRVFVQDQITLSPHWQLTLSASAERNPYTGTEMLPSLRIARSGDADDVWWASLSRAVRAPSRIDREFHAPAEPPYVYAGGPDFRSEVSDVVEIGHRAQLRPGLSVSLTAFHHEHRRLRSVTPTAGGAVLENHIDGSTSGLQGWFNWRVLPHWRLQGGGVVLDHRLKVRPGAVDFGGLQALGNDPDHWWSLRSALDVSPRLAWGLAVRHTGTLPQPRVPSYTAVDTTLGWRLDADTELSLVVRNVLDGGHAEWGAPGNRAEFGRSASVLLRWRL